LKTISIIVLAVVLAMSSGSGIADIQEMPSDVRLLVGTWYELDESCRGGHGNESSAFKACYDRKVAYAAIEKRGWCYGEDATSKGNLEWNPCKKHTNEQASFIELLQSKYANSIEFDSDESFRIVSSFNIECKVHGVRFNDGRFINLLNVLYFTANEMNSEKSYGRFVVVSRGDEARIYAGIQFKGEKSRDINLLYTLNKWGELIPYGITTDAILNQCYSSKAIIWELPKQ